jgi:hypothetical protein
VGCLFWHNVKYKYQIILFMSIIFNVLCLSTSFDSEFEAIEPLLDCIDLHIEVPRVPHKDLTDPRGVSTIPQIVSNRPKSDPEQIAAAAAPQAAAPEIPPG